MKIILEDLKVFSLLTTFHLFSGYRQIPMTEKCEDVKTITCKFGSYSFEDMPFGVMNAPAKFERVMSDALEDLPVCTVYLYDIVTFSKSEKTKIEGVLNVLKKI